MLEAMVITTVIAILSSASFAILYWNRFRTKLTQFRYLIDLVNDSLYDNKVSDKEFQAIWEAVRAVLQVDREDE